MIYPALHHYCNLPLFAVGTVSPLGKNKFAEGGGAFKPRGLWVSDDADYGWLDWCNAERFGDGYEYRYRVYLAAPERLLWLRTDIELREFDDEFSEPVFGSSLMRVPDWARIAERFAGVIITPYQWSLRLADGFMWYYGWDCASGVIWDGTVVERVKLNHNKKSRASARLRGTVTRRL